MDPQNMQNSSGMMNGMPPSQSQQPQRKAGPLVAIIVIVVLLVVAAFYFFSQRIETAPAQNTAQTQTQTETQATVPPTTRNDTPITTSKADDVESLQAELTAELANIDYSF